MGKRRRKKKKKKIPVVDLEKQRKLPKAFVFRRGKVGSSLSQLISDVRQVMLPFTAPKLKEKTYNTLKDFLQVAGPLSVTHFLMFTSTDIGSYLRIARVPHGPTLTFRILKYSHASDVRKIQSNPHSPGAEFHFPTVLMLSGFGTETEKMPHLELMRITFREMFPAIPVNEVNFDHCRRTALIEYNSNMDTVCFRHYLIGTQLSGLNKSVKRVLQHKTTQLANYNDISDYVLQGLGTTESDIEAEDDVVQDTRKKETQRGKNPEGQTKIVRLKEIGPRMLLELIRIEDGMCSGEVHYHKHYVKSEAEQAQLRKKFAARKKRDALTKKKLLEKKTLKNAAKGKGKAAKGEGGEKGNQQEKEDEGYEGDVGDDGDRDDEKEEDIEWYRKEVGEEPDEELKKSLKKSPSGKSSPLGNNKRKRKSVAEKPAKKRKIQSKRQQQ